MLRTGQLHPSRFAPGLSTTHGDITTGDLGVSPDRTHTGRLPSACRSVTSQQPPHCHGARTPGRTPRSPDVSRGVPRWWNHCAHVPRLAEPGVNRRTIGGALEWVSVDAPGQGASVDAPGEGAMTSRVRRIRVALFVAGTAAVIAAGGLVASVPGADAATNGF